MGALEGRVAVITGAGRGLGREHALLFAREGASVVVNDVGGARDGSGADDTPAAEVVREIEALGGRAVVNGDDVSDAAGAQRLVRQAIDEFGALHILVNNAGILRDRMIVNMGDDEWDDVIRVHLRGHFLPTRAAAQYWREQHKAGQVLNPAVVNTTSTSGLFNHAGQGNYGAAKTAIACLTMISHSELGRYGVRVNAIAPSALTRMTAPAGDATLADEVVARLDPANVSPFVAYLATETCPIEGRIFFVSGGKVLLFQPFAIVDGIETEGRWTVEALQTAAPRLAEVPFTLNRPY
ncbi:SDR family NAD(P)-dependent oxidoreductase [Frankia sp. AgB1.9]|uniref:SDR family oxidoreductase n=1 Tax=unclassified Frankia TaxID=2632575 RepID=UPI00193292F2|nr:MULTISPECIES: SDR family oxidoreductase [unclassified Frankia]MBL7490515.1 SDR family NAD(P)-dependent oxidoreductase [Frankia sp. AgW1.1]MBL7551079.1 SDR family NAD(P)-dependent oxidoreductase [Frankia sp. AgB1.9]MBL7621235.1 SDR family NAD(P)-dependent oxidoreductase [Frankia sp. AgB1.8]